MVAVAYRRWSFTRGSNCKALTGKILVFWIGGRLWDVVAYESWSHMEVRLYFTLQPNSLYRAVRLANFEGILGFSVASIIVTELVGSIIFTSDWCISIHFVCFCVSRLVACDRPSGNNPLVFFEDFSDLSYSCLLQE